MSRKKRVVRRRRRGLGELPIAAPTRRNYSRDTMKWVKRELSGQLKKCGVDGRALKEGMLIEQEHGRGVKETAKIALDHLCERVDYYQRLKRAGL